MPQQPIYMMHLVHAVSLGLDKTEGIESQLQLMLQGRTICRPVAVRIYQHLGTDHQLQLAASLLNST